MRVDNSLSLHEGIKGDEAIGSDLKLTALLCSLFELSLELVVEDLSHLLPHLCVLLLCILL